MVPTGSLYPDITTSTSPSAPSSVCIASITLADRYPSRLMHDCSIVRRHDSALSTKLNRSSAP